VKRILVVDDNPDNRYSFRLLLEGYEIEEAADGPEALAAARANPPDCILLDVRMPGMDGLEVCRQLRAEEVTRSIPVVLLTAHERDTESVVRGLAAGADDYVTKPVARQELLARVRAMLRVRDLREQLEVLNGQLEQQVRRRTEELRQIYGTVPVGIYTLDAHGRVTSFNHHLESLLLYQADEVVRQFGIGELFAPDYDAVYWLDLCRREGKISCETLARSRDGRLISVLDERVANTDEFGERVGFTGYIQDLSREKRIRSLLSQQEKQAEVGHLAAGIVHEIANPIGAARQYMDSLLTRMEEGEPLPEDDMASGFVVVRDALQRTTGLLQNLRKMTRVSVDPGGEADPSAVLRDLHTLMRHDLQRREIAMTVSGKPCQARCDAGSMSQVFMNLITNARDAMPEGGTLSVEVTAQDSLVRIDFRDTGEGIPEENLSRIFQFLFTTKGDQGTGYGLAISRDIVEGHGGTIEVDSRVGAGTCVSVTLPRRPGA